MLQSTSELQSSRHNSFQYRDLVPLDGRHKRGQLDILLAIFLAREEVLWFEPGSYPVMLGAIPHISWGLDQTELLLDRGFVEKPVVEAADVVADMAVDMVAEASVEIEVDNLCSE